MQKIKPVCDDNLSVSLSFDEMLERVKGQIDFDAFPFEDIMQARELACIIAEVMRMRPSDNLKIDGRIMPVADVQAVYSRLENEHIANVMESFNQIPYVVRNKKAYLRTALYNAVFELGSSENNQYAVASGGEK